MGLDVELFAVGDISDEQIEAADELFAERSALGNFDFTGSHSHEPWVARSERNPERVTRLTVHRYYGPGYERGNWPLIYADIILMFEAFPGSTIFYGNDCQEDCAPVTPEMIGSLWKHWAGPDGRNYHKSNYHKSWRT